MVGDLPFESAATRFFAEMTLISTNKAPSPPGLFGWVILKSPTLNPTLLRFCFFHLNEVVLESQIFMLWLHSPNGIVGNQ